MDVLTVSQTMDKTIINSVSRYTKHLHKKLPKNLSTIWVRGHLNSITTCMTEMNDMLTTYIMADDPIMQ